MNGEGRSHVSLEQKAYGVGVHTLSTFFGDDIPLGVELPEHRVGHAV